MINRFTGRVESAEGSVAWLRVAPRLRLAARRWEGLRAGTRATVSIRGEDVILALMNPGPVSARNVLPGHVRGVRSGRDAVAVTVDVGAPLVALVTREARKQLGLAPGREVFALVKATAVVPEAPARASRFEVGLVGEAGAIGPARLRFLAEVERTGSITSAARAVGVTYRTGWLWAREANRAWGAPLVLGGPAGAVLTAEGRRVLERWRRAAGLLLTPEL